VAGSAQSTPRRARRFNRFLDVLQREQDLCVLSAASPHGLGA
jgi:hypothetical protein